jgi:hypothetical protein
MTITASAPVVEQGGQSRWRRLPASDRAWSGVRYVRALVGLDMPTGQQVRQALALLTDAPEIGRWLELSPPRWRPVTPAEREAWLDRVFAASAERGVGMDRALAVHGTPLTGVPLRVVAGPDWISVAMSHAVGDGWTVNNFLGHLLRQAACDTSVPLPWRVLPQGSRDLVIARDVLGHLGTLGWALRRRDQLAGGVYEPAVAHADRLADQTVNLASDAGFLAELRAVRDAEFPGVSAAVVAMVGLRAAFASTLAAPRPGFECLFNTRSAAAGTADGWGNWSAGVYVHPTDDYAPAAVAAEIARVREAGLAGLAHASLRARARRCSADTVQVARAEGAPRLTMSYTQRHLTDPIVPGLRPGESVIATRTRPNGVDSVTVQAVELAGRLSISVACYPDVWAAEAVESAVRAFLTDPHDCLRRARREAGRR